MTERTFRVIWTEIDGTSMRRWYKDLDAKGHHELHNKTDRPIHVVIRRNGEHAFAVEITLAAGQECGFECLEGELEITFDRLSSAGSSH